MKPPVPLAVFVWSSLAWGGLLAAGVPILIHLLSRRRLRRIRWAAMDFLLQAAGRNRRRLRLEELLLLSLRCLAVVLVGLMLARWISEPPVAAGTPGSDGPAHRILLIDDSLSMGLQLQEAAAVRDGAIDQEPRTVFDVAVRHAGLILERLQRECPRDTLTVMRTSFPDEPLCRAAPLETLDLAALRAGLAATGPTSLPTRLPAAFQAVQFLVGGDPPGCRAVVYLISDFRQVDWPAESSPARVLTAGGASPAEISLILIDVGREVSGNLSVEDLRLDGAPAVAGVGTRMVARLANRGPRPAPPGTVQVRVDDALGIPQPLPALGPGQVLDLSLEVVLPEAGGQAVSVELPPDLLPGDNAAVRGLEVLPALRVLLVDGEPSLDPYDDEAFLLATALRPEGPQFSGNEVNVVSLTEFEALDLAQYHLAILANVPAVDEEAASRLEAFVAGGGGLLICLGDQVDPVAWNRLLGPEGHGLLPARLGEAVAISDGRPGRPVTVADGLHGLTRGLVQAGEALLSGPLVQSWMACEPVAVPASAPQTASAGETGTQPPRTLLTLDGPDGPPLLVERPFGAGRVALWTTSADKEWNTLAEHPLYVVLAMELASHLARRPADGGVQLVGEPVRLLLDPARHRPEATLRTPRFPAEPAVRLEVRTDESTGRPLVQWGGTRFPGRYEILLTTVAGTTEKRVIGVNVDPRESDLTPADRQAILAGLEGLNARFAKADEPGLAPPTGRREWWRHVLVVLVGVLMLEQLAAWWFGGERRPGRFRLRKAVEIRT